MMMVECDEMMPPSLMENGILDVDFDLEHPQPRDRCNTWPLQRPAGDLGHHTSPLIHERIPEEETDGSYDEEFGELLFNTTRSPSELDSDHPQYHHHNHGTLNTTTNNDLQPPPSNCHQTTIQTSLASPAHGSKKSTARKNAWGNLSYADLITQAIINSPEKRLTLSQIYDWMVQNVPYFRDKGDSNSSAGWKNSIRHNLSLHSRFVRIQNEGAGKSSWWVLNPDAKPGKASRRRTSTMPTAGDDSVKSTIEKKRRGAKKRVEQRAADLLNRIQQNVGVGGTLDFNVDNDEMRQDGYSPDAMSDAALDYGEFRNRSGSNLSTYSSIAGCGKGAGSRCLSPTYEDLEFIDWDAVAPIALDHGSGLDLANSVNASLTLSAETSPTPPSCLWQNSKQQQQLVNNVHQNSATNSPIKSTFMNGNCNDHHLDSYSPTPLEQQRQTVSLTSFHHSPSKTTLHQHRSVNSTAYKNTESYNHQSYEFCVESNSRSHFFPQYTQFDGTSMLSSNSSPVKIVPQRNGTTQCLPVELSDIQYDALFKNDVQCDIDQVIRHELRVAGKLDFNIGEYFANI